MAQGKFHKSTLDNDPLSDIMSTFVFWVVMPCVALVHTLVLLVIYFNVHCSVCNQQ
jgi:uncharacterized membrane protein